MSGNIDLYTYLNDKFGKCEILSNGTYYVNHQGNHYYFSSDCLETDINLMAYHPGTGGLVGGNNSAGEWNYHLKTNGVPSGSVVMVSPANSTAGTINNFSVFDEISADTGINASSVESVCFSGSGGTGIVRLGEFLTNHPELNDTSAVIDVDGYIFSYEMNKNPNSSTYIRDNKIPIYMVTPPNESAYANRVKSLTANFNEQGFNAYLVVLEEKEFCIGHEEANRVVLNDGFSQYIIGASDELGTLAGYDVFTYKNGEYIKMNLEDARIKLDKVISMEDVNRILIDNGLKFEENINPISSKYNNLLSIDKFNISYNSASQVLTSDLQYVENFSNEVMNSLKNDNLFSASTISSTGGCGPLIEKINECLDLYYDSVGQLLSSITLETESIVSVGQAIADMDMYLKNQTPENQNSIEIIPENENINDSEEQKNIQEHTPNLMPGEITKVEQNEEKEEQTNENYQQENQEVIEKTNENKEITEENTKEEVEHNIESTIEKENNITESSEVNIKENTNDISSKPQTNYSNYNNPSNNNINTPNQNLPSKEVIYEGKDYNLVFEVNGDDIVSLKYQHEFTSYEEAIKNYDLLVSKYKDSNIIENIILNENNIEIIFKSDIYNNMNIEAVLKKFGF